MKQRIIAATLFSCMLAACGSSKDPSNANFQKVLDTHFAKNCISFQPFVVAADGQKYPMTVELQPKNSFVPQDVQEKNNAGITKPLDVLTHAGVLTMTEGTKQVKPMFGNGEVTVPTKTYSLTDEGKKALVSADSSALCIGHFKVDEVVRFTEPNKETGTTISEVYFTASPIDVPAWAKDADVQKFYGLNNKLGEHSEGRRTLVLASDGWIDSSDFAR